MASDPPPAATRLRRALEERDLAIRGFSRQLAKRGDVTAGADSVMRTLRRALNGEQPLGKYDEIIESELGLPTGYLFEESPTAATLRVLRRDLRATAKGVADNAEAIRDLSRDLKELRARLDEVAPQQGTRRRARGDR